MHRGKRSTRQRPHDAEHSSRTQAVDRRPDSSPANAASVRETVLSFAAAYNFAKHLKPLEWRTPFQTICDA